MDPEYDRETHRRSYRLSRAGFALMALVLVVGAVCSIGSLVLLFTGNGRDLGQVFRIEHFYFWVETVRVWARIISVILLCAAWPGTDWRRRAGLLLVMAMGDIVLWAIEHGMALGLADVPSGHDVFRHSLSMALGWAKFALVAGMAADVAGHLGVAQAPDFGKAARATATTGASLWAFYFLNRINWQQGWPLAEHGMNRESLLIYLAVWVISAVCLVQTSLLCMIAGRASARALREMSREDQSFDPWQDRS